MHAYKKGDRHSSPPLKEEGILPKKKMKEELIVNYLKKYYENYGYMPTYREIQQGLNNDINSTATVHHYITKLIKEGKLITSHPGCPRALRFPRETEKQ